jgi:hypothetical protein
METFTRAPGTMGSDGDREFANSVTETCMKESGHAMFAMEKVVASSLQETFTMENGWMIFETCVSFHYQLLFLSSPPCIVCILWVAYSGLHTLGLYHFL